MQKYFFYSSFNNAGIPIVHSAGLEMISQLVIGHAVAYLLSYINSWGRRLSQIQNADAQLTVTLQMLL